MHLQGSIVSSMDANTFGERDDRVYFL